MNKLLRHYEKLYLLRLNGDGSYAEIETYQLSGHPNLNGKFDIFLNTSPLDEWEKRKLVEMEFGASRLINFSPEKDLVESELKDVRQSLKNYHAIVSNIIKCIKKLGHEDFKQVPSKKNLEAFCSFSDTFYLCERPFIKLIFRLGHIVRVDPIATEYDLPCWSIDCLHRGAYSIHHGKELLHENKPIEQWLDFIFKEPEDIIKVKNEITKQVHSSFNKKIQICDILFNPAEQCYLLKEDVEQKILKDLMPEHDVDTDYIAKYTSFETLISILDSGKIRMNSIVSMNDKTETDFLEDTIRNFKEVYERDIDKFLFADKEFITSFTTKIDDLDMWRLYGDDARGACLVFERKDKSKDNLYKINYVSPDADMLSKTDNFINTLKSRNIRFQFWLLHKYCHFIKHIDYTNENELRFLEKNDMPNGWSINGASKILTPFIEKNLKQTGTNDYPFRLKEIILGPAMREYKANLMQVFYMCSQKEISVTVSTSKISSYR